MRRYVLGTWRKEEAMQDPKKKKKKKSRELTKETKERERGPRPQIGKHLMNGVVGQ